MNRREFLRIGLITISYLYWLPDGIFDLKEKGFPWVEQQDTHRFRFRGRFEQKIEEGKIRIPHNFLPLLVWEEVHFVLNKGACLILIPGGKSVKKTIEHEIKEVATTSPQTEILYLGSKGLAKDGWLSIPAKIRKLAGLTSSQVVIAGMLGSIEIWDKYKLDEEIKRIQEEFSQLTKTIKLIGL